VDEKTLLNFILILSIAGIALLYLSIELNKPVAIDIDEITPEYIGKLVEVVGTVSWVKESNGNVFFGLKNDGYIKVVVFRNRASALDAYSIREGDRLKVIGTVSEYRGEIEIIPKRIIFL